MERLGRFSSFGAVALILFSISSIPLFAQNEADSCATALNQPSDVSLRLSLKDGQSIFREGETITLIAEYSSTAEKKYHMSTRNYDRSGRLSYMEVFCVTPDTGTDPLADYFNGIGMWFGGGLGGDKELGREAQTISLELNEWKSLTPGSYRLSVLSHRIYEPSESSPFLVTAHNFAVRSNEVEFQVIPAEPAWQAEQLSAALRAVDSSGDGDEARHAARVLRFLGSEASTRELARRYWASDQPFGWDLKFGLFGSPHRTAAIEGMKAALGSSQHPVTEEFAQMLATLEIQADPKLKLPVYDEHHDEEWKQAHEIYIAEFDKRTAKYMSQAAAAVQSKTGKARAVTVTELLLSRFELEPAAKSQLRQVLLSSWASLPGRRQAELIQFRWEQVGGPEWLPTLKAIVAGEPNLRHSFDQVDRGIAMRRIYEFAPEQGRDLILKEISNPKGDVGIETLGMLPEKELPPVEQPVLTRLKNGNGTDVDYQLIERYASVRVFPEVKSHYGAGRGRWACVPQTAMLLYFLRVQPQYEISQFNDAFGQREKTGCYRSLITAVGEKFWDLKIERIAIAALNDESVDVQRDAAEALGKYGSARAESALWTRLEKFHQKRQDKAEELSSAPSDDRQALSIAGLEQNLVQAITNGQAWFATEETVHRLQSLVSPQLQNELEASLQEIEREDHSLTLNWSPQGMLWYNVGHYQGKSMAALKQKLAQFPAGTRLSIDTTKAEKEYHKTEFEEIQQAAEGASLVLHVQTSR